LRCPAWGSQEPSLLRRSPSSSPGIRRRGGRAVREAAREDGVEHLIAIIRPDNVASQAVARRIGLTFEREIQKNGGPQ